MAKLKPTPAGGAALKSWLNIKPTGLPAIKCMRTERKCAVGHCSKYKNSGTRPNVMKKLRKRARAPDCPRCLGSRRSNKASKSIAGPRVMSRNNKDGGYFVTLKNEITVSVMLCCLDQREGSP